MMLHDKYTSRSGLTKTAAASNVALFLGLTEKTIRCGRKIFWLIEGAFLNNNEDVMHVTLFLGMKNIVTKL